jgi:Cu(I)/Ag(I) efflux system membrane fusion protein
MTLSVRLKRIAVPILSAVITTVLVMGFVLVQRSRDAWPFPPSTRLQVAGRDSMAERGVMADGDSMDMKGPASPTGRVAIDVAAPMIQTLGIQIEAVRREALTEAVRVVATVAPDESRISHVHTRVAGWIEQLDINTTGEMVEAGQPLARILSQELLSSQTEYLAARKMTATSGIASAVVASGRTRLTVLGMAPAEIDAIERSSEPQRLVTVVAPRSGVVVYRGVTVGTSVDPSTTLLTIADLSRVWIVAEVPEANMASVRVGTRAQLDFPGSGRPMFAGRVDFVYPTLSERTRTLRVRLSAANPGGELRPGLFGSAVFESSGRQVTTISRDAVVNTGVQQHVFVAVGDRFEPRTVTLGVQLADRVEIRSGLAVGEQVVTSGVFLLDSESRLRATGGGGGHGGHGAPSAPAAPTPPATVPPSAPVPHTDHRN